MIEINEDLIDIGAVIGVSAPKENPLNDKERKKAVAAAATSMMEEQKQTTEDALRQDEMFIHSSKVIDEFLNGEREQRKHAPRMVQNKDVKTYPEPSGEEWANRGFQVISDAKNALYTADSGLGLAGTYLKFKDAPDEVKHAMLYMWEEYEKADMTFDAFGRAVKSMGKDPSTYTGIGLGYKFFGQKAATTIAKERFKNMLLGGITTAGFSAADQAVEQTLQGKTDINIDPVETSLAATIGLVAIPGIEYGAKAVGAAAKTLGRWAAEGEQLMMKQAGGGTPPQMAEFVSVLQNTIENNPQKSYTKEQLVGMLSPEKGIKAEEMKWSGLQDYLDTLPQGAKVSKEDVLNNINNPQLDKTILDNTKFSMGEINLNDWTKESLYGETLYKKDILGEEYTITESRNGYDIFNKEGLVGWAEDLEMARVKIDRDLSSDPFVKSNQNPTKYQNYATQGVGTNYREELTTLSPKLNEYDRQIQEIDKRMNEIKQLSGGEGKEILDKLKPEWKDLFTKKRQIVDEKWATKSDIEQTYSSSHWDEPNVLYHVRKQDTEIDGDNTLLIEEIQSDWHQEGRKKGYEGQEPTDADVKKWFGLDDKISSEQLQEYKEEMMESREFKRGLVPQAPYSKTWHEKAMKDQIQEAVEQGYDRVAWVAGKEQADRYSLAKQVDELQYFKNPKNGNYEVQAYKNNSNIWNKNSMTKEEVETTFGKETLEAMENTKHTEIDDSGRYILSGVDLEFGGEGMKGFYDEMLPDFVKKYIKKYDSKLEIKTLPNGQEVWSFKVTDKMKKDIKEKGQPLYQVGGATTVGGIAASQQEDNK